MTEPVIIVSSPANADKVISVLSGNGCVRRVSTALSGPYRKVFLVSAGVLAEKVYFVS